MPGRLLNNIGRLANTKVSHQPQSRKESSPSPVRAPSVTTMEFIKHQIYREKEKRKSLSEEMLRPKPAKIEIAIESPPLVSYGTMENSTGALMSGQLRLHVTDQSVRLDKFELELVAKIKFDKPVSKDCSECQINTNRLKKWDIISEPKTFEKGSNGSPFSYLLPGHLPATTHTNLGSVEYSLIATAISANGEKMTSSHILELKRSIFPPDNDRTAVRVFPPTNLRVEMMHPPVVHPIGEWTVNLCLSGIVSKEYSMLRRWRLRRLTWRVEEFSKMVSKPCTKHVHKVGGEGKGLEHTDTRVIGSHEIKDGWKSDWTLEGGGSTMVEFPCHIDPKAKAVCDMSNPTGMAVQHRLMLELVVLEEIANPKHAVGWNATGSARVLRMAYTIVVTERAGMGISWDEEMPPMYEEVPASPPGYIQLPVEDFSVEELGDLNSLARDDPLHTGSGGDSSSSGSSIIV